MTNHHLEISLSQWIDTKWFRGLARACMIGSTLVLAGFATAWAVVAGNTSNNVAELQANVATVTEVQGARAKDSEAFQAEVRGAITGIKTDIGAVNDKVYSVSVDVGVIKRLVQELRQKQTEPTALSLLIPPAGEGWSTVARAVSTLRPER